MREIDPITEHALDEVLAELTRRARVVRLKLSELPIDDERRDLLAPSSRSTACFTLRVSCSSITRQYKKARSASNRVLRDNRSFRLRVKHLERKLLQQWVNVASMSLRSSYTLHERDT